MCYFACDNVDRIMMIEIEPGTQPERTNYYIECGWPMFLLRSLHPVDRNCSTEVKNCLASQKVECVHRKRIPSSICTFVWKQCSGPHALYRATKIRILEHRVALNCEIASRTDRQQP